MPHSTAKLSAFVLGLAVTLGAGALVAGQGCFSPPSDDVLFACEPEGDDRCPEGYSCQQDGCCHKEGTDVEASFGACALGGQTSDTGGTGTDTGGESGTETGTGTESESGTDTDTTGA